MDQLIFGFTRSTKTARSVNSICVVPLAYWNLKRRKMHNYIENNDIADQIEELGLIEYKQNTFEFDNNKYSKNDIINMLKSIPGLEYSNEFEQYLSREEDDN